MQAAFKKELSPHWRGLAIFAAAVLLFAQSVAVAHYTLSRQDPSIG